MASQLYSSGIQKIILTVFVILGVFKPSLAQSFEWRTGFHGFFDNREYFNEFSNDQTIFGSRFFADAGFAVDDRQHFRAGFSYTYEFGSKGNLIAPDLTLYYHYVGNIDYYLGAFPRHGVVDQPLLLLTDTLNYFRPNVEGIFLEWKRPFISHNLWIDWIGRQAAGKREVFVTGGSGRVNAGRFFYKHDFNYTHYALPADASPEDHIRDNGGFIGMLGADLSTGLIPDTFCIATGVAFSFDRLRNVYDTKTSTGWYSEAIIGYRGLSVHGTFYKGDAQMLIYGDHLFSSGSYQRLDLSYRFKRQKRVSGYIRFSAHFIPHDIEYSQKLVVYVSLEGSRELRNGAEY